MRILKTLLAAPAVLVLGVGIAQADPNLSSIVYSPLTVTVWNGNITDQALLADQPGGTPFAQFTYSGPIAFNNNNPQSGSNTFADFGFIAGDISGFSGTAGSVTNFLSSTQTMSTIGETFNSYLEFKGSYSTGSQTSISVTHDDGASFYINGNPLFTSAGPTSKTTNTDWLTGGTNAFDLVYVESNGAPAILDATVAGPSVPEPGSLALFAAGLVGLGWMLRRRRGNA